MSKYEALRFLDDYKKDRALMEKVEGLFDANPGMKEGDVWVLAAKESGYEFNPEDLAEAFSERVQDDAKASAAKVDESELAAVAGGFGEEQNCHENFWCAYVNRFTQGMRHPNCKENFLSYENCWHNDGCDNCFNIYANYQCKRSGECELPFTHR